MTNDQRNRDGGVRRWPWAVLLTAVLVLAPVGAAAEGSATRKAGRGLAAMTCAFLELPGNIVKTTRERGPGWGLTLGFVEGLGRLVVRPLVGVYEFVTAPFEIPADYAPIIEPEFPWDYFSEPPRGSARGRT